MAKETGQAQAVPELNAYVSSPGPRAPKQTTFRQWVVDNQIGMKFTNHAMFRGPSRQGMRSAGIWAACCLRDKPRHGPRTFVPANPRHR